MSVPPPVPLSSGPPRARLPAIALLLPACFVVEVILGGPQGLFGGVGVRFLLLAGACGALAFALLVRGTVAREHVVPVMTVLGFVLVNGIWVAVVPVLAGTDLHWAVREPHAFIVFTPVVLALALLRPEQLTRVVGGLQRLVVGTSLVLAVFQVGLWAFGTLAGRLAWVIPYALSAIYPGAVSQLYVGPAPDGFFRVFWISTLWCVLSFFWAPAVQRPGLVRALCRGLLALDIIVAYTRGIWLGLAAGLVVSFVAVVDRRRVGRGLLQFAAAGALGLGALAGLLAVTGSLQQGASRLASTTSREDVSISSRVEQAPFLLELWYAHPIMGSGYGAYVPGYLRSQEAPYSYEHMPYALLAKLGLAGVLANALLFAGLVITVWQARRRAPVQAAAFLGGSTALLISEMTNPMVLNFVSMTIFACLLLQWASLLGPADRALPTGG